MTVTQQRLAQLWPFFVELRKLPIEDSSLRFAVLCALLEFSYEPSARTGASVSWIADRVGTSRQIVRYHLEALRADEGVMRSGMIGKTWLYTLTPSTKRALERCLSTLITSDMAS